jgi:hypothetical protein
LLKVCLLIPLHNSWCPSTPRPPKFLSKSRNEGSWMSSHLLDVSMEFFHGLVHWVLLSSIFYFYFFYIYLFACKFAYIKFLLVCCYFMLCSLLTGMPFRKTFVLILDMYASEPAAGDYLIFVERIKSSPLLSFYIQTSFSFNKFWFCFVVFWWSWGLNLGFHTC